MRQNLLLAYASDFVSLLLENATVSEHVNQIIVFGSVARGDFDETSDLDLFIDLKESANQKFIENVVKETLFQFETISVNTWGIRNIILPIKPICGLLRETRWKTLNNEMIGLGVVLYGKYNSVPKDLRKYCLLSYSSQKLPQKKKMQLLRALYGYSSVKAGKKYQTRGIISSLNAKKTGSNQLLVIVADVKKITAVLNTFKVPFRLREVWFTGV